MIFFQIIFYFMYNIDIILCAYIYKKRSLWICVQQNFIFFLFIHKYSTKYFEHIICITKLYKYLNCI